jgi:two-component system CheB/CheR fusion protein
MELDRQGGTSEAASPSPNFGSLRGHSDAIETLRRTAARLVDARLQGEPLRIWVPGCGSGELVYALAAIVREEIHRAASPLTVRIFATDVDAAALRRARGGWLPIAFGEALGSIDPGVHFVRDEAGYQATPALRDMCLFAAHDVMHDPPLHRLDAVVCGELPGAERPEIAHKLSRTFHFALAERGLLVVDPALPVADSERFVPVLPGLGVFRIRSEVRSERPASLEGDGETGSKPFFAEIRGIVPDLEDAVGSVENLDRLRSALDRAETSSEQLVSANEELQCTQEELYAANEDLEATNAELQRRVSEIDQLHADLDNILRSARLPTVFLDREGRIRWLSPSVGEVLRSRPADIGRPLGDVRMRVHGADLVEEAATVVREEGPREVSVERPAAPTGFGAAYFRVRLLPYRSNTSAVDGVVLTFLDVTELEVSRRRLEHYAAERHAIAELGLLALESTIDELLERTVQIVRETLGVPCCEILVLDARGELLRREAMAGWPRAPGTEPASVGTLAAHQLAEREPIVEPASAPYIREAEIAYTMSASIRDDASVYGLLRAHAAERGLFRPETLAWVSAVCSLVGAAMGRHCALERLREQSRHKDDFLAMLGHELRNPLAAIASASELQRTVHTDDPLIEKSAAVIGRQVGQMVRVIDDLLDVSRFTRGKIALEKHPVDFGALVRSVVDDHRDLGRSGLELELVMSAQPIVVLGDRDRLVQVLNNLVSNAVQFTDPPGTITISLATTDGFAELRVTDTGCGIAPEFLTQLFEPFRQAPQSLARQRGGLGLGLALVEQTVVQLGGRVQADSPGPGGGATFTVLVPLAEQPAENASTGRPQRESLRILLVEDNRDAAEVLALMLGEAGHEVTIAGDAAEGWRVTEERRPDVILCDIGLPGDLDGYGFARFIGERADLRPRVMISVSGYGRAEDIERARRAGFDLHLTKPVDFDSLQHAISRVLEQRSAPARP